MTFELTDDHRRKVEPVLLRWLQGETPEALGLTVHEDRTVPVMVDFARDLWGDDVARLLALGVDLEEGDQGSSGHLTRDQLDVLVRDEAVISLGASRSIPVPRPPHAHIPVQQAPASIETPVPFPEDPDAE